MEITGGDLLTFIAATAAVIVSICSWVSTHRQLNTHHARESWFERYTLAVDQMFDQDVDKQAVGVVLIRTLMRAEWASAEDRETALKVAAIQAQRVEEEY